MAELLPASFADLVTRLHLEPKMQNALFELPRRRWYAPRDGDPDLSVRFHGKSAGNAVGPAAGPHTQMAQNLLLSYVAGSRILELKTVQVDDRLKIPRPCIDVTNIGYNVEWSQELLVEQSLREYVAGAMLIEMFRRDHELSESKLDGAAGEWLFDISVGYDLKGIKSRKVCNFLEEMRNAGPVVDRLRSDIPTGFRAARDAEYPTHLSNSITLSTFHGCPADEIERISEFLLGEMGFDLIVKMNPPTLGREKLEHLLFDVMGYTALTVNPKAYGAAISFDESIALAGRLGDFAARRDRKLGFKFSNTLEVVNHRDFFTKDNEIMYLSGQPLHVITMALTSEFRAAVGPGVPISFSAGIDQRNFPMAVACGFVPVTTCTDLLRPGGYGRLPAYLHRLVDEMLRAGAASIDEFVLKRYGHEDEARRRAEADGGASAVAWAALLNTNDAAAEAREDSRYYASANGATPKRIDSHLQIFDCITCDKCLPVCPNAANFLYPTPIVRFDYHDYVCSAGGWTATDELRRFEITRERQIACYADFCNECGNCDTFCPEYGGPYIEKPSFFASRESWERAAPRDGFFVTTANGEFSIIGRIRGDVYELIRSPSGAAYTYCDGAVRALIQDGTFEISNLIFEIASAQRRLDMGIFHTLRFLMHGILDRSTIHQVNAVTFGSAND